MTDTLEQLFDGQHFANEYQLVNGVAMHTENPENFHIPPEVIKRHVRPGQFIHRHWCHCPSRMFRPVAGERTFG